MADPPKNENHFAVVLGFNCYLHLSPLRGAAGDAQDFRQWLVERAGLPQENVLPHPPFPDAAQPTIHELTLPFERLLAMQPDREKPIGRRLYIFLSGHGLSDPGKPDETGFVCPTFNPNGAMDHFVGEMYANFFWAEKRFDEIVLLMDCCRETTWDMPSPYFPYKVRSGLGRADRALRCYAYAVGFSRRAKEHSWDAAMTFRGVFSWALREALMMGRAADEDGRVTSLSLKKYLEWRVPELRPAHSDQEPKFTVWENIDFAEGWAAARTTVRLSLTRGPYMRLKLRSGANLQEVAIPSTPLIESESGMYCFSLAPNRMYIFSVEDDLGQQVMADPFLLLDEVTTVYL